MKTHEVNNSVKIMNGVYFFEAKKNGDTRSVFEKYPELCKEIGLKDEEEQKNKKVGVI